MSKRPTIADVREQIDALDIEMLALANHRIDLAKRIGEIKLQLDDAKPQFYRPEREAQVLRRLKAENQGAIKNDQIETLFRELMSICRGAESGLVVAVLGPEGTFTEQAAARHFGSTVHIQTCPSIDEVFRLVETGGADFCVVPIENSTEGGVTATNDRLVSTSLRICGESLMPIHQFFLAIDPDIRLDSVKRVYSHAQSIAQCRRWIETNLSQEVELVRCASNAEAARIAQHDPDSAAIAGELAAQRFNLAVIDQNIEDEPDNTTRFLVLSHDDAEASGDDKTTLLLSARNQPGALYDLLKPLQNNNVSMTRIESRPSHVRRWEYIFFVDIEGHRNDKKVAKALLELEREAGLYICMGSYPRAD